MRLPSACRAPPGTEQKQPDSEGISCRILGTDRRSGSRSCEGQKCPLSYPWWEFQDSKQSELYGNHTSGFFLKEHEIKTEVRLTAPWARLLWGLILPPLLTLLHLLSSRTSLPLPRIQKRVSVLFPSGWLSWSLCVPLAPQSLTFSWSNLCAQLQFPARLSGIIHLGVTPN